MVQFAYRQMRALAASDGALERSIGYLSENLGGFLKKGERVLICFPGQEKGSLGWLMERAVLRCGGAPVIWGPDYRWKTLLQQAFYSRATTILAPPLIVLGLSKLKKYTGLPVYIRRVVTAGYPCLDWMIDGIIRGLDCQTWGSFGIGDTGVVAGFSCGQSRGVHLRDDEYGVDIVDEKGNVLPEGEVGEMVLYPKAQPELRYPMGENARLDTSPCTCGCASPRLMDLHPGKTENTDLADLGQQLQSWTSVLDCRLEKGQYGLELEMVVFAGEKLPRLPAMAKQVIRPWDPKQDEPFRYVPVEKNSWN